MGFVEEDRSGMAVTPRGGNLNRDDTFTICWIGNVVLNASTVVQMHSAETLNRMETMLDTMLTSEVDVTDFDFCRGLHLSS